MRTTGVEPARAPGQRLLLTGFQGQRVYHFRHVRFFDANENRTQIVTESARLRAVSCRGGGPRIGCHKNSVFNIAQALFQTSRITSDNSAGEIDTLGVSPKTKSSSSLPKSSNVFTSRFAAGVIEYQ